MVYTSAFGGVFESIDQILVSRHFRDSKAQIGEMEYFSVFNDHLTDGSHQISSRGCPCGGEGTSPRAE